MEKITSVPDLELRRQWIRFGQLGVALIILGAIALATAGSSSVSVAPYGWLLVVSGVLEIIHALQIRRSVGFFLHLVPGIAPVPIGLLLATRPDTGALAWTFLFASLLMVIGLYRTVTAFVLKLPNWGWAAGDGLVTVSFAIAMWAAWPWSKPWFFGLAVGSSLMLRGWSTIKFAAGLRNRRTTGRAHLRAA